MKFRTALAATLATTGLLATADAAAAAPAPVGSAATSSQAAVPAAPEQQFRYAELTLVGGHLNYDDSNLNPVAGQGTVSGTTTSGQDFTQNEWSRSDPNEMVFELWGEQLSLQGLTISDGRASGIMLGSDYILYHSRLDLAACGATVEQQGEKVTLHVTDEYGTAWTLEFELRAF